jgi:peptidoglycan/LPS O-acetylase OafA/YrhL
MLRVYPATGKLAHPSNRGSIERFSFANQLRGIAALCVAVGHLTGVYWSEQQLVAGVTFAAVVTTAPPGFSAIAAGAWYSLGPFGVALFFLISGFVIPLSLERQTAGGFLIGRAFRIYPTYIAALAIELAVVACSAAYWHRPFTYRAGFILANALLVTDIVNVPSIDLVNWTLTIELKFYLVMALLAGFVRRGSLVVLFALAAFILFVSRFSHEIFVLVPGLGLLLRIFESNALYLLFMLIGVVFSYHARRRIGTAQAIASVIVLFAAFVVCWPLTFFRADFPVVTYNYGYALVVFAACYALRRFVPDARVADFFAAISYPLYLVHSLVGYVVLTTLLTAHVDAAFATLGAFAVAVALAFALHRTVEKPSQAFGKSLAARVAPVRSAP